MSKSNVLAGCLILPFVILFVILFVIPIDVLLSTFFVLRFAVLFIFCRNTPEGVKAFAWRGAMCEYAGIYKKAEYYYREAALISSKYNTKGSKRLYSLQTLNLGVVQRSNGNLEQARYTLEIASRESKAIGNTYLHLLSLQQLSSVEHELGNTEKASQYAKEMNSILSSTLRLDGGYIRRLIGTGWTSPTPLKYVLPYRMLMLDVDIDAKVHRARHKNFLVVANILEVGLAFSILPGIAGEYGISAIKRLNKLKQELSQLKKIMEVLDAYEDSMGNEEVEPSWLLKRRALSNRPGLLNTLRLQRQLHCRHTIPNGEGKSVYSRSHMNQKTGNLPYSEKLVRVLPDYVTALRLVAQECQRCLNSGNLIGAKDYCLFGINMAMARPNAATDEVIYYCTGIVCLTMGKTNLAFDNFCRAIECIENVRRGVLAEDLKLSFLGARAKIYEDTVLATLKIDENKAFEIVERARSRALLDIIGEHAASLQPLSASEMEIARLRQLREKMKSIEQQCNKLYTSMPVQRGWNHLSTIRKQESSVGQLRRLRRTYERLHERLQARDNELASFYHVTTTNGDEVCHYLDSKTLLVEYFVTESKIQVFLLSPNSGLIATTLDISRGELRTEVEAVLPDRWSDVVARLRAGDSAIFDETSNVLGNLYQLLIKPMEQQMDGVSRLVIIPHGLLHYVPFHALCHKGIYLIDQFEISYAPSASVLQFCKKKGHLEKNSCLIIKDPRGDLTYAAEEVNNVSKFFQDVTILPSDSQTADLANVLRLMPSFDVIHFVCHGKFDSERPMTSFLELRGTRGELEMLTVDCIYELQLNCNLATLSACETGVSKILSGDELIGLSRGFIYAGVPSLLVSLWKVDDKATSELMGYFYKSYILDNESKSSALQRSILQVKGHKSTSHPFFWAAFCLIGDSD